MYYAPPCVSIGWSGKPEMNPILSEHPDEDVGHEITALIWMARSHRAAVTMAPLAGTLQL